MSQLPCQDFESFRALCQQVERRVARTLVTDRPLWIFGAGQFGRDVCSILRQEGFNVQGFIESTPRERTVLGLPVLAWSELAPDQLVAQLVVGIFNRGMPLDELQQLGKSAGFSDILMPWDVYAQFEQQLGWRFWLSSPRFILDKLAAIERTHQQLADEDSRRCLLEICAFRLGSHCAYGSFAHPDRQYFNELTLGPLAGRSLSYVDGGAYNGDTFLELASLVEVSSAYLFEPDIENFRALSKAARSSATPALCLPLAVSDRYRILSFNAGNGEAGSISEQGSAHIAAAALDDVLGGCPVDFIKLDVEGAEIPALRGAAQLIKHRRPVLAISLYHRAQDIWEIPLLLSEICENYRFYIRQHYGNSFDSVLYAIPNR